MLGHCAVPNCTGGRSDSQPLFRFPLDAERCKQWTEQCQREDLSDKPAEQLYKFQRVCGKHFEPSAIDRESQAGVVLKDDAVPTISDESDGAPSGQGKRKDTGKVNEKDVKGRKKLKKPDSEPAIDTQPTADEDENREFLKSLFEVVLFLGGHNLLPTDRRGGDLLSNFRALVEYRINSGDKTVQKKWGEFKEKLPDELSHIMDACEQCVRLKLVEEVLKNGPFSLLTDELVLISGELQLPVLVRFVDESNRQQERFLGFVSFSGDEEDAVVDKALSDITEKWGLGLEKCRCQAHSCSGTHSGKIRKLAAKVTERCPAAALTLRSTQTVNLVLAANMAVPGVQLVTSTLRKVEAFFGRSPLLRVEFEHAISLFYADREEKANTLKEICQTNWTSSHNVFEIAVDIYESLLLWLDSVNDNEDVRWSDQVAQDAMVISKALTDFEFLMTLIVLKNITALTKAFGKSMLGDAADVSFAANSLPAVLVLVKEVVDNIDVYHEFWYEEAVTLAAGVDVAVRVPRAFSRKRPEGEDYYRERVSLAVVQGVHAELSQAFGERVLKTLKGCSLVPAAIEQKKSVKPDEDCVQFFKEDVPNAGALSAEFSCWWVKWCKKSKQERFAASVQDTLQLADMKFFPNMLAAFRLMALLPCLPLDAAADGAYRRFRKYMQDVPDTLKSKSIAFMNINSQVQSDLDAMVQLYLKTKP